MFTIGKNTLTVKNAKDKTLTLIDASGKELSTVISDLKNVTYDDTSDAKVTVASGIAIVDASTRTTAIKITANKMDNSIVGGTGKDTISAGAGNDTIFGGKGNDYIYGGKGNDLLWGQDGADTFVYATGDGKDNIYGFDDDDLLQITGTFTTSYNYEDETIKFTVGTGSITLKDFTATTFNVNGEAYEINNNNEFVKK